MDRYFIVLIDNVDDINLSNRNFFDAGLVPASKTASLFETLQQKKSNIFIKYFNITAAKCDKVSSSNLPEWQYLNNYPQAPKVELLSVLDASEEIFFLTDKLPYPGSYLLDVCWFISEKLSVYQNGLVPLLGCLKKLKSWHSAEISIFTQTHADTSLSFLTNVCNFLSPGCKPIMIDNTKTFLTSMKWNKSVLWKGHLNVSLASSTVILDKFELIQHSCCNPFIFHRPCNECNESFCDTNFWFGGMLKAIELINATTVPLFWHSGSTFLLCCKTNNPDGKKLQEILISERNAALLCHFNYISSKQRFKPCVELHSRHWKDRIKNNPSELTLPSIILCQEPSSMFFLLTTIDNNSCDRYPCDKICFHAHALHCSYHINKSMLLEEHTASSYKTDQHHDECVEIDMPQDFSNAALYQYLDKNFGKFFVQTMQSLPNSKVQINKETLQRLIQDCCSTFDKKFRSAALSKPENIKPQSIHKAAVHSPSNCFPEIDYLRLKDRKGSFLLPDDADVVTNIDCIDNVKLKKNMINASADEILTCFSGDEYHKYITDLTKISIITGKPSADYLSDFVKALSTSYHGINYNIDAQGSEKKDKDCRKLVKRLIKYETLSIGSNTQVLSAHSANFNDSPIKSKQLMHSPRKKKKIAKVAEKLYKKKSFMSSTGRSYRNIASSKVQSDSVNDIFKTPTKSNSTELKKNLLVSPSVHKMTLRSSTPTKPSNSSKKIIKTKNLTPKSKFAAKRKLQKQYVKDNKKRLHEIIVEVLFENDVKKGNPVFDRCIKKLYQVSLAFLKDLKTSENLENKMQRIVRENARLVLSLGL